VSPNKWRAGGSGAVAEKWYDESEDKGVILKVILKIQIPIATHHP